MHRIVTDRPPAPHLAERRAIQRVEASPDRRTLALTRPTLTARPRAPHHSVSVLVTGPSFVTGTVLRVVGPLVPQVGEWDGRTSRQAPDLVIAALPWRYDSVGDVPDLPGPLAGAHPAVLPLSFAERTVTVGPVAGALGACLACVHPALAPDGPRPDPRTAPALVAFAAGAAGLFVRAFLAAETRAMSMSLTFDITAPHVEHRLWSCTPTCRRAA